MKQIPIWQNRILVWFSCGAASAVVAKKSLERFKGEDIEICYCDTFKYEHPDNKRFFDEVQAWIGREIKILRHPQYKDIYEVFRGVRYIKDNKGAPCTRILKRDVRLAYSTNGDRHVFGMTADETERIKDHEKNNSQLWTEWILQDEGITKQDCYNVLYEAGIEFPAMYKLGYHNNNCIGCVKGGMGYWNKIRVDFPEAFTRMAKLERELNYSINKVFLDELPPNAGRFKEETIECGVLCIA